MPSKAFPMMGTPMTGRVVNAAVTPGRCAAPPAPAKPDLQRGQQIASTVCVACHGANGVSVTDAIPNLAGQKALYIENQLKAFKDGVRKAPSPAHPTATMAAIATQLSPADITMLRDRGVTPKIFMRGLGFEQRLSDNLKLIEAAGKAGLLMQLHAEDAALLAGAME